MRILDLFCGAGGAAMGYARAGFEVVGVDIFPQKNYPFDFIRADATEFPLDGFDFIHASPPCQAYSAMSTRWKREHPKLIGLIRNRLIQSGKPYVIENVPGADLIDPIMLCGTMFGLQTKEGSQLRRHRLFECSLFLGLTPECRHNNGYAIGVYGGGQNPARRRPATIGVWGNPGGHSVRDNLDHYGIEARREAMGIDWMSYKELSQSIPPAYTEWIGRKLLNSVAFPCYYRPNRCMGKPRFYDFL